MSSKGAAALTMAYVEEMQCKRKFKPPCFRQQQQQSSSTRQVSFVPGISYVLVRAGIVLDQHPEEMYQKQELTEAHLWHFRHADDAAPRNGDRATTQFVAALCLKTGEYIRPQHKYMQMCYKERKRGTSDNVYRILDDGSPWWTDSYLVNQLQILEAKERYKLAKKLKTT
jgi:hypothetical protein